MRVTEVRVTLVGDGTRDGLIAYCTISFDSVFVIHDVKLVRLGTRYIVSMPSRKLTGHCRWCKDSNHIRAEFCNRCGKVFDKPPLPDIDSGPEVGPGGIRESRYFVDVAHPIRRDFRDELEVAVVDAYFQEKNRIAVKPRPATIGG